VSDQDSVIRTYRFVIDEHDKPIYRTLLDLTRVSKDLYNQSLFFLRKRLDETGKFMSKYDLSKEIATLENLEGEINYKKLPSQSSQQTIFICHGAVSSYFRALKVWKKDPSKFKARPEFPKFLKKDSHQVLCLTNQVCSIHENVITFGKRALGAEVRISIPEKEFDKYQKFWMNNNARRMRDKKLFNQIRVVPQANADYFNIEICYNRDKELVQLNSDRAIAVDIGVNNLMTVVSNFDDIPFIINGKPLKSINQFFNKKKAEMSSALNKRGLMTSKRIRKLFRKRNAKVSDYMHKASRHLIEYCLESKISKIVIGYNAEWKVGVQIGKINNQNFVMIPFHSLISKIEYKAELHGIEVVRITEGYTSKCSALDLEPIKKHEKYVGRRLHRGLFKASNGQVINADVNGSLNILRKAIGDSFVHEGANLIKNPIKITMQ